MLNFGNKEFRNLQEQVLKNMRDIQDIEQGATVLADFGIKVVGQVDSTSDLPDPTTYEGEYGDAYLVGTEKPYNYYIFTRAFEGQEDPSWFDLGEFPVPGPQGATGPQGETGLTPVIGATVGSVSTLQPGQSATASVNVSGTAAQPTMTFNFAIPQGAQGIQGPQGAQGPQGLQGPKGDRGEKGEQGGLIDIVGIVATASDLPAPSTLQKLDAAYLVGASPDYELYVQVGETPSTALWTNLGKVNEGTVVSVNGTPQTVWEANTKVSVSEGYLVNTLYGQAAGSGNGQTHVPYGSAATANYIVQRDVNGQVLVPETPTANNQAASKAYVDANASVPPIQYAGDLIVGDSYGQESRLAIGSAGQVLTVNSSGNGLEYTDIEGVPSFTNTDANKALKVNSAGNALEWGDAGGGLKASSTTNNKNLGYFLGTSNITLSASNSSITNNNSLFAVDSDIASGTFTLTGDFGTSNSLTNIMRGSIYLTGAFSNPVNNNTIYRSYNSIIGAGSRASHGYIDSSCVLSHQFAGPINIQTSYINAPYYTNTYSTYGPNIRGSIIVSANNIAQSTLGQLTSSNRYITDCFFLGEGHNLSTNSHKESITVIGSNGILDPDSPAKFTVGAGTSSTKANCFTTGKNSTDGNYITIGTTKLTEAQLQALIALLG